MLADTTYCTRKVDQGDICRTVGGVLWDGYRFWFMFQDAQEAAVLNGLDAGRSYLKVTSKIVCVVDALRWWAAKLGLLLMI
jgi:hypothetical protein